MQPDHLPPTNSTLNRHKALLTIFGVMLLLVSTLLSTLPASSEPQAGGSVLILPSKDNTIYEESPGNSNGKGQHLFAGRAVGGATNAARRALIHFDIASQIPAGSQVLSATFAMDMSRTSAGPFDVNLHKLTVDWGEGTSDAPGQEGAGTAATIGDATWSHTFHNTILWTTSGGDFAALASASTNVSGNNNYTWSSAQMVTDVQAWLDSSATNFGWAIIGDETPGTKTVKRFDSRESVPLARGASGPTLVVSYSTPTAVGLSDVTIAHPPSIISLMLILLGISSIFFGRTTLARSFMKK